VQSRLVKRVARISGNVQEIHDIVQYEWKLWWRFSNITTVIAFTFWIMQAVSATLFARIITELIKDMKKYFRTSSHHTYAHARVHVPSWKSYYRKKETEMFTAILLWIF